MNEKFLSRGKRKDNEEWVQGYYVSLGDKYHYILTGVLTLINRFPEFEHICVESETVGRFTGLTDKNGKKIFEGDIISYEDEAPGQYEYHDSITVNFGAIEFSDGSFYFTNSIAATINDLLLKNNVLDCEVIGNIHDNPEILEA